jgi:hypothetical protein
MGVYANVSTIQWTGRGTSMTSVSYETKTVRVPLSEVIRRLELFISRMERRYECSSSIMAAEVEAGTARETAEISKWLGEYQVLSRLRAHGRAGG